MTVKKTVGLTVAAGSIAAVIVLYRTFAHFSPGAKPPQSND